jgi:hypothetical protein
MLQTEPVASFRQLSSFSTGPRCTPPTAYQGCLVNSIFMGRGAPGEHESFVANFAQEVVKGQLPLSVEGLSGQGVEQFGRSAALVSGLRHHLSFLDHVHEFDPDQGALGCLERFEP